MPPQFISTLLDNRGDNLQAEWSVCTTLWETLGWDILRSAAFYLCANLVGCVLIPVAVGRGLLWPASSSLRRPFPKALTLLIVARKIIWRLRLPFLGECRRGPRHFCECQACLGYGSAPGPTNRRPCAPLVRLMERATNTDNLRAAWQ